MVESAAAAEAGHGSQEDRGGEEGVSGKLSVHVVCVPIPPLSA